MSEGWIALHRGWRDNPVFKGEFSRADAWLWLIEAACWKPTRFDINGKTVTIERGQLCASVRHLADVWGWSKSAVDRYLSRLETETMIGREAGHGRLVITICNYAKYQDLTEADRDSSGTPTGTAAGHERDIKEQGNKGTIVEVAEATPTTRKRAPVGWPPIPAWVPAEPWAGYLEMRKRKGATPTGRAVSLLLDKLDRWRSQGHDPGAILDASTVKNWTDLFEPKDTQNGRLSAQNDRGSVRGSRPNPALDMVLQAERELQAEAFSQNTGSDWSARLALPSH